MIFGVDFLPTPVITAALVAGGAIPLYLVALAIVPILRQRTGWRMAAAGIAALSLWCAALTYTTSLLQLSVVDGLTGLLIIASAWIAYLIVWGSLTRGYTFGLLMTLYNARRPITIDDVEKLYAGGRGLRFLMEKRVFGLILLRIVRQRGRDLTLTSPWGISVARMYRLAACALGLRRTG